MKVAVSGSRHWRDRLTIRRVLAELPPDAHVAHGAARGADSIVDFEARKLGLHVTPYPVDHALDGPWPAAGHRRNERMIREHDPELLIAFRADGKSNGTDGAVRAARAHGALVETHHESQGRVDG